MDVIQIKKDENEINSLEELLQNVQNDLKNFSYKEIFLIGCLTQRTSSQLYSLEQNKSITKNICLALWQIKNQYDEESLDQIRYEALVINQDFQKNLLLKENPSKYFELCLNKQSKQIKKQKTEVIDCQEEENQLINSNDILQKQIIDIQMDESTKNLIIKMQEEDEKDLQQRKQKQKQIESAHCPMCFNELDDPLDSMWGLLNCNHCFHQKCLQQYLDEKISIKSFPIICPQENCKVELCYEDIEEILPQSQFEKYQNFSLKNYFEQHMDEISNCPTPNCNYAFIYDNVDPTFNCPVCKKIYCLNCKVEFHKGQNCQEFQMSKNLSQDDQKFLKFVKGQKYKMCPKCKFWVEKSMGCNYLKCRCKNEFCYQCGQNFDAQQQGKCGCKGNQNPQLWQAHNPVNSFQQFNQGNIFGNNNNQLQPIFDQNLNPLNIFNGQLAQNIQQNIFDFPNPVNFQNNQNILNGNKIQFNPNVFRKDQLNPPQKRQINIIKSKKKKRKKK